jgi:DNA repair protein RecO (recombination protein O)
MLETAERLTPVEKEPAIRQFLLLIGGLRALGEATEAPGEATDPPGEATDPPGDIDSDEAFDSGAHERDPRLVLDAYFLRSLAVAGYAPALAECARCGRRGGAGGDEARLTAFAVGAGGMVCEQCRMAGATSPGPQTVALMIALLRGDWAVAMRSERRHRVECSGLVAAYLQWHLEHSIRSLRHVERA